jgi:Na+-transporting methylmalonyl-CoA/oxaloacetate decarboxylase gamma subunit
MSILESLMIAAFCLAMVFAVLAILFLLIKLFSFGINAFFVNKQVESKDTVATNTIPVTQNQIGGTTGELKLKNVDEKTAAMIMAIVSDESKIPLSELNFKSIKLVENTK